MPQAETRQELTHFLRNVAEKVAIIKRSLKRSTRRKDTERSDMLPSINERKKTQTNVLLSVCCRSTNFQNNLGIEKKYNATFSKNLIYVMDYF